MSTPKTKIVKQDQKDNQNQQQKHQQQKTGPGQGSKKPGQTATFQEHEHPESRMTD